jgi:hypothetical protein
MVAGYYPSQSGYIETDNKKWREMMASSYSLKKVSYCAMDIFIVEWNGCSPSLHVRFGFVAMFLT